ncbi:hypothetical protein RUM43_011077 [Polyplax serrata]|uniref:Uncharacterized protein n=1 Tax=Polyplax serrata TaxID=468196 RepID=A0AAN8PEP5_POLSC
MVQLATEEGIHEELIKDRSKFTNKWPIVLLPLSVMCGSFYSMGTYFNENKDLGHPSGFPYRHQFPDFEIVTTIELISGIAGFMILIGFDSMIMTLFSLEEIQLLHLKESLYQITNCDPAFIIINKNDNYRALSLRQQEQPSTSELEENIRIWCIRHQNTLKFHDELQNLFGPALSLKNILLVLTFCIIGFFNAVRIAPTKDLVAAACYVLTSSLLYYVNATFADSIHDANQTIFDDAFGNNWHQFPPHILSSIRIIQIRAQRALQFMTLKIYPLNSGTFLTTDSFHPSI